MTLILEVLFKELKPINRFGVYKRVINKSETFNESDRKELGINDITIDMVDVELDKLKEVRMIISTKDMRYYVDKYGEYVEGPEDEKFFLDEDMKIKYKMRLFD
jgi:hypothetical protein